MKTVRRIFGGWLAMWLIVPAVLVLLLACLTQAINNGMIRAVKRYDAFTKRALRNLDEWIKYGREPIHVVPKQE